jgi:hypothetical protein
MNMQKEHIIQRNKVEVPLIFWYLHTYSAMDKQYAQPLIENAYVVALCFHFLSSDSLHNALYKVSFLCT